MNKSNDGGPAFSRPKNPLDDGQVGMSLRDYFAAAALPGCMEFFNLHPAAAAEYAESKSTTAQETIARMAWDIADAMLAAREAP